MADKPLKVAEHIERAESLLTIAENLNSGDRFHTIQAMMAKADIHLRLAAWKDAHSASTVKAQGDSGD